MSQENISYEAQRIVEAFENRYELLGPFDGNWQELCLAAAFRELSLQLSFGHDSGHPVINDQDLQSLIHHLEFYS